MTLAEAALWMTRAAAVLPALARLWTAVGAGDSHEEVEAQLGLVRAVKDAKTREAIGGPTA